MEEEENTQHEAEQWEQVFSRENLLAALEHVQANRGVLGIDGMTVEELPDHLRTHWAGIRGRLERGTYRPSPVKRVEIPKPGGGVRGWESHRAGRFIQQALAQVLSPVFEPAFSEHSHGFRPGRSACDAVQAVTLLSGAKTRHGHQFH